MFGKSPAVVLFSIVILVLFPFANGGEPDAAEGIATETAAGKSPGASTWSGTVFGRLVDARRNGRGVIELCAEEGAPANDDGSPPEKTSAVRFPNEGPGELAPTLNAAPYQGGPWCGLGGEESPARVTRLGLAIPQDLAIDREGRPHLIWDVWTDKATQVCYAYWDGARWTGLGDSMGIKGVSHSAFPGSTRARLALDREDRPHIIWTNNADYRSIEYRYWDGEIWQQEHIGTGYIEASCLALAIDSLNRPHVAYLDPRDRERVAFPTVVQYLWRDGAQWRDGSPPGGRFVYAAAEGKTVGGLNLALDADDEPHLAWDCEEYICYIRRWGQGAEQRWAGLEQFDGPDIVNQTEGGSFQSTMVLDGHGLPHIVWRQTTKDKYSQIYYRYWDGRRWAARGATDSVSGPTVRNACTPKVAVDPCGTPHVAWGMAGEGVNGNDEVYYRFWNGQEWAEIAGSATDGGVTKTETLSRWLSLAVDIYGQPHIVWGDGRSGDYDVYHIFLPQQVLATERSTQKPRDGTESRGSERTATDKSSTVNVRHKKENMVLVPAGEFTMGGDRRFEPEEKIVFLDAFYIDKYEVTNRDYKVFVDATGRTAPRYWLDGTYPPGMDNYPAYEVTWQDAQAYAIWVGKRLPTDQEWEKAARGTDGRLYPWGNEFDAKKCNSYESKDRSSGYGPDSLDPVDSHPEGKSPYGCHNMTGNVWEWTSSPTGLPDGRILRGGSCGKYWFDIPVTRRVPAGHIGDDQRWSFTGFRCAADPPNPEEQ